MRKSTRGALGALVAGVLSLGGSSASAAGAFTTVPITNDASTGISPTATYTALANFGEPNTATVNGVNFPGFNGGATITGTNFTLAGANNDRADDGDAVPAGTTGSVVDLLNDFVFGTTDTDGNAATPQTSRLTLTNLTVGAAYRTTFYNSTFGPAGGRQTNITTSDGGATLFDENYTAATNTGNLLRYDFVATSPTLVIDFDPVSDGDTFHHYAFSNEAVPEPASLGLVGLGAVALLARRRGRRA